MGAFGGPDIITDGLDYLIDAGSTRSYIGTGTTVNSLAGSAASAMYNGVGFQSGVAYGTWRFDGVNDYISTTAVLVSSPTSLTIGGWFKRNGNNGSYATVLHHGANNSIGTSSYFFGMYTGTNYIIGSIGANVTSWTNGVTNVVADVGVWYNVITTWDGSEVKVYVNGILKNTWNLASYTNLTTPTRVGSSADGTGYLVNGDIAHVFVAENKHYSAAEVLQNYNAQKNRFI